MKCPKCSYVSFDYNLTCPKCDKDISSEQEKLHLPAFRPDPPFLLGALTGEVNDPHMQGTRGSAEIAMGQGEEVSFDDESAHFDSGEVSLPESGDFELSSEEISLDDTAGLSLDSGRTSSGGKTAADDILGSNLDTEDAIAELGLGGLRADGPRSGTRELKLEKSAGATATDNELSLDLGESPEDEGSLDLGSLELEGDSGGAPAGAGTQPPELQLDGGSTEELDKLLDMDEIKLEEVSLEAKPGSKKDKAGKAQDSDLSLDLEDLDLELDLDDTKPH
jgi:hypothetical protein